MVFTIYGHGGHLVHVTWIIYVHIGFPFIGCFILNLALIGQAVSEKKIFEYYGHIRASWGTIFFRIINLQSICPFPSTFSLQMTF